MQSKFLQLAVLAAVCQTFVSSANAASIDINALESRAEGLNAKCKSSTTCGFKYYCNKGRCARKVKIGTKCRKAQQCRTGVCDATTKKCVAKPSVTTTTSASATVTPSASVSSSTSSSTTSTSTSSALPAYTPSFAPAGKTPLYTIQDSSFDQFDAQYWTTDNSNTDIGKSKFNGGARIASSAPGNAILQSSGSATGFEQALGSVAWTSAKNGAQNPSYTFAFSYLHYGSFDKTDQTTAGIADQCTLQPYIGSKTFDTIPLTPIKPQPNAAGVETDDPTTTYIDWATQAPFTITSDMISGTGKPVLGFNYLCTNPDSQAVLRIDDVRLFEYDKSDAYQTVYKSKSGTFSTPQDVSQWYSTGSTSVTTHGDRPQTYNNGNGNGNALFTWNSTAGLNGGTVYQNLFSDSTEYDKYDGGDPLPSTYPSQNLAFSYDFQFANSKSFPTTNDQCHLDIYLGSTQLSGLTFASAASSGVNTENSASGPNNFSGEWNNQASGARSGYSQAAVLAPADYNAASKQLKFNFYCDYDVVDATLRIDDVIFG